MGIDTQKSQNTVENQVQLPSTTETPKTTENTTEVQNFDIDDFFKQLQALDKDTSIKDKKGARKELLEKNQTELIKQLGSKEFETKIKKARANPTTRENAYVLQVYAKYILKDETVTVDGIYGKQTDTVLKYVQTEGIGGVKREVTLTAEQRSKINSYKEKYDEFKKAQDEAQKIAQEKANQETEDFSGENHAKIEEMTNKTIKENPEISKYINEGTIFKDQFTFTDELLNKLISDEEIKNMISPRLQKYFDRDEIKKDALDAENFPKQKKERIQKRLEKQEKILENMMTIRRSEIQENLFKQAKENAVRGCLNVLEQLVDQTVFSGSEKEQFGLVLANAKPEDIKFDTDNLVISSIVNGKKITLDYNITEGSLSMTQLLHKENGGIFIGDETKQIKIIDKKLPSFKQLINESGKNIVSKIESNCTQPSDIQDAFLLTREPEITDKNVQKETISKNLQENSIANELANIFNEKDKKIIGESKKESSQYKLYDIFFHTFGEKTYTTKDLINLKRQLQEINTTIFERYRNPNNQTEKNNNIDDNWFGYFRLDKNADKNQKENDPESYYQKYFWFFGDRVSNLTKPTDPQYRVLQLNNHSQSLGQIISEFTSNQKKLLASKNTLIAEEIEKNNNQSNISSIESEYDKVAQV